MTTTFRAHFDGRFIVPDESVDLPVNQPLELELRSATPAESLVPPAVISQRLERLALASGTIDGPTLSEESLRRENLYEERP